MNPITPFTKTEIREIKLDRETRAYSQRVARQVFERAEISRVENMTYESVEYRFITDFWKKEVERITVKVPEGRWDAVKHYFFPEWLQDLCLPIRYKEFVMRADAIYPTIEDQIPGHLPILRIYIN